jgi:uncharacterized membrane protein YjdF
MPQLGQNTTLETSSQISQRGIVAVPNAEAVPAIALALGGRLIAAMFFSLSCCSAMTLAAVFGVIILFAAMIASAVAVNLFPCGGVAGVTPPGRM